MNLTVDASVFVSASRRTELHHLDSNQTLKAIIQRSLSLWCPNLVVVETVAALARTSTDTAVAQQVRAGMLAFSHLHLVPLDDELADLSADLAASQRLRGADAVYLAVAQQNNTALVTWDNEMLQRGGAVVPTLTPTDWLAGQTA